MTELEKARAGRSDVDLNQLTEELRERNQGYLEKCSRAVDEGFEAFEQLKKQLHQVGDVPSINLVFALNTFLNKIGMNGILISDLVAALDYVRNILFADADPIIKVMAVNEGKFLEKCLSIYKVSVETPKKTRDDENAEEM